MIRDALHEDFGRKQGWDSETGLAASPEQMLDEAWLLMGRIVSPVITTVLFYALVTPTALLFRLLGKDLSRLSRRS